MRTSIYKSFFASICHEYSGAKKNKFFITVRRSAWDPKVLMHCRTSMRPAGLMPATVEVKLHLQLPMLVKQGTQQTLLVHLAKMLTLPMRCTVKALLQPHRYACKSYKVFLECRPAAHLSAWVFQHRYATQSVALMICLGMMCMASPCNK